MWGVEPYVGSCTSMGLVVPPELTCRCAKGRVQLQPGAGRGGHVGHKTIPVWMLLGQKVTVTVPLTCVCVLEASTGVHIPWQGRCHSRGWRRNHGCCGTGGGNEPWHVPWHSDGHLASPRHYQSSLHGSLSRLLYLTRLK